MRGALLSKYEPCPCDRDQLYHKCCKRYHDGELPISAVDLMRSRFSAYALNLPQYIIDTTDRDNPAYEKDHEQWRRDLESFSKHTRFDGLRILSWQDLDSTYLVKFKAILRQGDRDATFTEESTFTKKNGKWLYSSGKIDSKD